MPVKMSRSTVMTTAVGPNRCTAMATTIVNIPSSRAILLEAISLLWLELLRSGLTKALI